MIDRVAVGAATETAVVDQGAFLPGDEAVGAAGKGLEVAGAVVSDIAVNVVDVPVRWNGEPGSDFINEAVQPDAAERSGDPDVAIGVGAASVAATARASRQAGAQTRLETDPAELTLAGAGEWTTGPGQRWPGQGGPQVLRPRAEAGRGRWRGCWRQCWWHSRRYGFHAQSRLARSRTR